MKIKRTIKIMDYQKEIENMPEEKKIELTQKQIEYIRNRYEWATPKNYERLAKYLKISL